jgi:PII-like signaling protein
VPSIRLNKVSLGASSLIHTERLLSVSEDLPVAIVRYVGGEKRA